MHPSNLRFLRAEFLNLNTADILSRIVLAVRVCAQHPWPLSTRCQYNSPQVVTTKDVSRHDQIFPGKKNHSPPPLPFRTTGTERVLSPFQGPCLEHDSHMVANLEIPYGAFLKSNFELKCECCQFSERMHFNRFIEIENTVLTFK